MRHKSGVLRRPRRRNGGVSGRWGSISRDRGVSGRRNSVSRDGDYQSRNRRNFPGVRVEVDDEVTTTWRLKNDDEPALQRRAVSSRLAPSAPVLTDSGVFALGVS